LDNPAGYGPFVEENVHFFLSFHMSLHFKNKMENNFSPQCQCGFTNSIQSITKLVLQSPPK